MRACICGHNATGEYTSITGFTYRSRASSITLCPNIRRGEIEDGTTANTAKCSWSPRIVFIPHIHALNFKL